MNFAAECPVCGRVLTRATLYVLRQAMSEHVPACRERRDAKQAERAARDAQGAFPW